jgi:HprK-related kinase A
MTRTIGEADGAGVRRALRGTGIVVDFGLGTLRVRSDVPDLAEPLRLAYRHFAWRTSSDWIDLDPQIRRPWGLRRWLRPQAVFVVDRSAPLQPFPADTALPLLEWGTNWLIGRRLNDALLLHAGALERDGLALVLPATPGSGKSTLSAALSLRGWRLLSDEFGALDTQARLFRPVLKPVALKNESIDVIAAFSPGAAIGPRFPKTRKGTVAHLAASPEAVAAVHVPARPGAVVLPRWQAGAATSWTPLPAEEAFSALAFNAFNYPLTGIDGFRTVLDIVRRCPAWRLVYSDLDDAIRTIDRAWPEVVARAGSSTPPPVPAPKGACLAT